MKKRRERERKEVTKVKEGDKKECWRKRTRRRIESKKVEKKEDIIHVYIMT